MLTIDDLEQQAIDAAINLHWDDAIDLNKTIIKEDKKNLAAYLRLGFVYLQKKELAEAKNYYNKALKIQPINRVANENLERIQAMEENTGKSIKKEPTRINPTLFLEIPGRTKTIPLVKIGQKKHIAGLSIGQQVILKAKSRKIEVRTKSGSYVGCFPDDISKRLLFFLKAKSEYVAYIQESSLTRVTIFLKEVEKGARVRHLTSFPDNIQSGLEELTLIDREDAEIKPTEHEHEEEEDEDDDEKNEIESLAEELPDKDDEDDLLGIDQSGEDEEEEE